MNRGYAVAALLAFVMGSMVFGPGALAENDNDQGGRNAGDPRGVGDPRFTPRSTEAACNTRTMAAAGGPTLKDRKTLLVRWMGYTNYELVYGDKIILLDNGYYNRTGTQYKDLGFTAADIKRADLI